MFTAIFLGPALALWAASAAPGATTPQELVERIHAALAGDSEEALRAVYPFEGGLELLRWGREKQRPRRAGLGRVLRSEGDRAVLLLSALAPAHNSGDDVLRSMRFSGLYEARREGGAWRLGRPLPIDEGNRIARQAIDARIEPGSALEVVDRLTVEVGGENGFLARLNHRAGLQKVLWNDRPAEHAFGGGLLWVRAVGRGVLTLAYRIEVERGPEDTNSGCFLPEAGHVRNQYLWHPFFDFSGGRDRADFEVTVRVPAAYRVATSVPQTETVEGAERVVRGRTIQPTFALTLLYDRDWRPQQRRFGGVTLEVFATADFDPPVAAVMKEFERLYRFFSRRFGVPALGYFAVVQGRARRGKGWHFASNQTLVAALQGGPMVFADDWPRAPFAHEVAHLWTQGVGPGAHFLQEGWASFLETLVLRARFGERPRRRLLQRHAERYFESFEGKVAILADHGNGGVSYSKGAWIFAMLEDILGRERFDRAMAELSRRSLQRPATWEELLECVNRQHPRDLRGFLAPWLQEPTVPALETSNEGSRVTIRQRGPRFELPLEVEVVTATGRRRKRVWLQDTETTLDFGSPVRQVVLDPDGRLLLARPSPTVTGRR